MLDPRTILVTVPCYQGQNVSELTGALVNCGGLFGALSTPNECSHISLVRNLIAANFLANPQFEWLVGIDADTVPSRQDMELLLQPINTEARYLDDVEDGGPIDFHPRPTRILCPQQTQHAGGHAMAMLPADAVVCAEYSYKNDTLQPVKLGMGFVRIHRSVFEALMGLTHDGGPTVEVQRHHIQELERLLDEGSADDALMAARALVAGKEDKAGQPRLWQTSWQGRTFYDFFPSGPLISQFVPTGEWKGEDHGFFTLCMLAGIVPRIETRTRLVHIGRKGYPYFGPQTGGGQ